MTSILTLAEKQQARSAEQAQTLQAQQDSALQMLSESMTKSLSESESIINSAISTLATTSDQLSKASSSHLSSMNTATAKTLSDYRETMRLALLTEQREMSTLLSQHRLAMTDMMQAHNQSVKTILQEQSKPYFITALIIVALILMFGILFGLAIAKILS